MAIKAGKKQEIENTVKSVFELCKKQGMDPNVWVIKAIKDVAKKKGLQMSKEEIAYAESYLQVVISAANDASDPVDAEVVNNQSVGQSGTTAKTEGAEIKVDTSAEVKAGSEDGVIKIDLGSLNLGKGKVELNFGKLFQELNNTSDEDLEAFGKRAGEQIINSIVKPAVSSGFKILGDILENAGKTDKEERTNTSKKKLTTFDLIGSMFR